MKPNCAIRVLEIIPGPNKKAGRMLSISRENKGKFLIVGGKRNFKEFDGSVLFNGVELILRLKVLDHPFPGADHFWCSIVNLHEPQVQSFIRSVQSPQQIPKAPKDTTGTKDQENQRKLVCRQRIEALIKEFMISEDEFKEIADHKGQWKPGRIPMAVRKELKYCFNVLRSDC